MVEMGATNTHQGGGIRITARLIGVTASAFWVFILVTGAIVEGVRPIEVEGLLLAGLVLVATAGVVLSFYRESAGGILTLVVGIALAAFALATAGRNHWLAVAVSGAPFMVAGLLSVIASRRSSTV